MNKSDEKPDEAMNRPPAPLDHPAVEQRPYLVLMGGEKRATAGSLDPRPGKVLKDAAALMNAAVNADASGAEAAERAKDARSFE